MGKHVSNVEDGVDFRVESLHTHRILELSRDTRRERFDQRIQKLELRGLACVEFTRCCARGLAVLVPSASRALGVQSTVRATPAREWAYLLGGCRESFAVCIAHLEADVEGLHLSNQGRCLGVEDEGVCQEWWVGDQCFGREQALSPLGRYPSACDEILQSTWHNL